MKNETILYEDKNHKCIMFSFDDEEHEDRFLSVNQFLIVQGDSGILIDPGSQSVFEEVQEAVSRHIEIKKLKYVFFSHQDPDVAGSIAEWSIVCNAKIIISHLWQRFMVHYGLVDTSRMVVLQDKGAKIRSGDDFLQFIPAHFLHSPGNFSLYDSRSKILFSGDIGAAIVPLSDLYKEVDNFEDHEPFLRSFHERYMAGNSFTSAWVKRVKKFQIDIIAPQHGAVFKNKNVEAFLDWFDHLKCGGDILNEIY